MHKIEPLRNLLRCCFGCFQLKSIHLPYGTLFCMLLFTDSFPRHCLYTSHVQQPCSQTFHAAFCKVSSVYGTMHVCSHTEGNSVSACIQMFLSPLALRCTNAVMPCRLFTHHSSGGSPAHSSAASNQQAPQSQVHLFPASNGRNAARFCICCKDL